MKILLMNIANNVTNFKTTPSGETIYLKKTLEMMGHDATIVSNKNGEFTTSFEDIEEINKFDRVLVIPAALNFFGGVESPTIINNYKMLAKWKGNPILVFQTDARLPFRQLWPAIQNRGWGYKKEDVWINSKIRIVAQSRNEDEVLDQYKTDEFSGIYIGHFPIDQYIAIAEMKKATKKVAKECDLIYGGSFRAGNRKEKMIEYLCGDVAQLFETKTFGTIKQSQLAKFTDQKLPGQDKKIPMTEVIDKISTANATIIIGEKFYNDAMYTLRVWECLLSDAVVLIDEAFDPEHKLLPLYKFSYVNSKKDVITALNIIKDPANLRQIEDLKKYQKERVLHFVNEEKYKNDLQRILNK